MGSVSVWELLMILLSDWKILPFNDSIPFGLKHIWKNFPTTQHLSICLIFCCTTLPCHISCSDMSYQLFWHVISTVLTCHISCSDMSCQLFWHVSHFMSQSVWSHLPSLSRPKLLIFCLVYKHHKLWGQDRMKVWSLITLKVALFY